MKPNSLAIPTVHLLFVLVFFCSTKAVNGQEAETTWGLKAGINFAELFGDDALPESDRKVGYSIGGFMNLPLSDELSFQPEAIWSLQGEKSQKKGRYDISYVNVPLMFKWKSGRFYTEAGPQIGFLTINTSKDVPDDIRVTDFESFDLAANVGVGYAIASDFALGIRYTQGLVNIVQGQDLKNSVIYVGLTWKLF
jgi:hypothetical protein